MPWPTGVDLRSLREAGTTTEVPYVGPATSVGTAYQDVPWLLEGLLELAESGAVPVVAIAALPDAGTTLLDPSLYLYGRLDSSVRQDQWAGTEGESEVVRVAELVVSEIA
jgi:hypothetical protein